MKVFISHRTEDYESFVKNLIGLLDKRGVGSWCSEKGLEGGVDWASEIAYALINDSDRVIVVISNSVLRHPQEVMKEVRLASQLEKPLIPILIADKPLPSDMTYHFGLNAIKWNHLTEDAALSELFSALGVAYQKEKTSEEETSKTLEMSEYFKEYTDGVFSDVSDFGGYSWGENKSVVQHMNGGWLLKNVRMIGVDNDSFDFEETEYAESYRAFLDSEECRIIDLKGKNHVRWMLTGVDTAYDGLYISVKKTEWKQAQFAWHHIYKDSAARKAAVDDFFDSDETAYPNSFCLHLVLTDNEDNIICTRIINRKKDDYPRTIAVTAGEQLDETDFTSTDTFMTQWLRRAMTEEFGFGIKEYADYVDEGSARAMALVLEGDIINYSIVCCVKLKCSAAQLRDYFSLHRSFADEFGEIIPVKPGEVRDILLNYFENREKYHPSSFLRLIYAHLYLTGKLPF